MGELRMKSSLIPSFLTGSVLVIPKYSLAFFLNYFRLSRLNC